MEENLIRIPRTGNNGVELPLVSADIYANTTEASTQLPKPHYDLLVMQRQPFLVVATITSQVTDFQPVALRAE